MLNLKGWNDASTTINIDGKNWMAENLNLADDGLGIDHWKNHKNNEVYYSWEAAMRLAKRVEGFHLPTAEEWNQLAEACGGVCRKSYGKSSGWNAYDNILELKNKLGIKLVGYYYKGSFEYVGLYSRFWTATEFGSSLAYSRLLGTGASMSSRNNPKNRGYSVRLVADS